MPDFFDFSNPNSPIDNGDQSWGGDMIYGGNQPIAPPANPFDSFMPQMPQGGMSAQVPFDALSAMNGIQMPQLPQQDSMGRYGITDAQRSGAGNQSLAAILMGAGQSMFDDNPNAVLQAASASGGIRRGALDKASQENVNAFKLQVEAKAKELDFISKKSDIERQQMQIEAEQMKLEDLKLKRQVSVQFGKEMAPVAADLLKRAENQFPGKVNTLKGMFLAAQSKLAEGDVEGANGIFDAALIELPSDWAKDTHEKMLKATLSAANKWGIGVETAKSPEFLAAVAASEGEVEWGADGMPTILSKNDVEIRNLRKQQLQEAIASEKARQDSYADGGGRGSGAMTQKELFDRVARINKAVAQLSVQPPQVDDPIKQYEMLTNRKELEGELWPTGLTIEQWNGMNDTQRQAAVFRAYSGGGAQGGGVVAPPQGGGGMPGTGQMVSPRNVQTARAGMVAVANKGPKEKADAIKGLLKSGDKEALDIIKRAKADPRFVKNPKDLDDPVKMFDYLAGKIRL